MVPMVWVPWSLLSQGSGRGAHPSLVEPVVVVGEGVAGVAAVLPDQCRVPEVHAGVDVRLIHLARCGLGDLWTSGAVSAATSSCLAIPSASSRVPPGTRIALVIQKLCGSARSVNSTDKSALPFSASVATRSQGSRIPDALLRQMSSSVRYVPS